MSTTTGTALYVGAVLGPGVLLLPGLAAQAAGPASVLAWGLLLVLSVPLAVTFAALGVQHPVQGGTSAYAGAAYGPKCAAATGWCFLCGVMLGAPTVSLIGGQYVGTLLGGGRPVTILTAASMLSFVVCVNAWGLQASGRAQLAVVAGLALLLTVAIVTAVPHVTSAAWHPFAPHGWWAVGKASSLLMMSFVGWEAASHLAGSFQDPRRQLPRAIAWALGLVTLLYLGIAAVTVGALGARTSSRVPLADLIGVGLGHWGRTVTAAAAVALTVGTMNAYIAGASRLVVALSVEGHAPPWFSLGDERRGPRRGLLLITVVGLISLSMLSFGVLDVDAMVAGMSALFVAVYVTGTAAGVRLLSGGARVCSALSFAAVVVVLCFSGRYAVVPVVVGGLAVAQAARSQARPLPGLPAVLRIVPSGEPGRGEAARLRGPSGDAPKQPDPAA